MFPSLPLLNIRDQALGNFKARRNLGLWNILGQKFLNGLNFSRRKLGIVSSCSSGTTAFFYHVFHVVVVGTQKQMFGVYAGSYVTTMADVKSFWNCTEVKLPRNSMSVFGFFTFDLSCYTKAAIAAATNITNPIPTRIVWKLGDLAKKALFNRLIHRMAAICPHHRI